MPLPSFSTPQWLASFQTHPPSTRYDTSSILDDFFRSAAQSLRRLFRPRVTIVRLLLQNALFCCRLISLP